jgi:hypothetical protein
MIGPVTPTARGHATLGKQFFQRLFKRQQRMRRRGETELPAFVKTAQLVGEIQTERASVLFVRQNHFAAGQHEAKSGNAFETLVGRRNQNVNARPP